MSYRGLVLDCLQVYESENAADNLARRVALLLDGGRAGVIVDIDGTISPIVAMPEQARVLPRAQAALEGLRGRLALVGVVTGRTTTDARRMVGLDGVVYIGNHGLEVLTVDGPRYVPDVLPWLPRIDRALDTIDHAVPVDGVIVERKGASGSVHYRLAKDHQQTRVAILEALARATEVLAQEGVASGLRIEEGRMVINVLPPLTVNKGSAVTWLMREHGLERIVYVGDDLTDAHAFRALRDLRARHEALTLSIGVVGTETPESIRNLADACVPTPETVSDVLGRVLGRLNTSDTMGRKVPIVLGHPLDERRSTSHGQSHAGNSG